MPPNPVDNPGFYDDVIIGNRKVPARIKDIRGLESKEDWFITMGIGMGGASTTWRGRKPIEGIEIDVLLNGETPDETKRNFIDWYRYIKFLKPSRNAKPPSYPVTSTPFKDAFVEKVVYAGHKTPLRTNDKPMMGTIRLNEYAKPKALLPAPPEDAILDNTTPRPIDQAEANFEDSSRRAQG